VARTHAPRTRGRHRGAVGPARSSRAGAGGHRRRSVSQLRTRTGTPPPLAEHGDERLRTLAQTLLQRLALGRRQDVVAAYQHALTLPGDAARGKEVFKKVCAACHRLEGVGFEIGPNLATLKNRGPETILVNVLDPSREVNPQYLNYVLATTDGRVITGLLADETASSVTLKRAENISETVLRVNIDELRSSGLSLMPEGMEKDVDPQAMADLIAYLLSLK
jgi:putative heme-binding domain-containing protein